MKRRNKGSGSIVSRGRGYCAVMSTRDPDAGKRTRKWSRAFATKREAQAELTRMLVDTPSHRASPERATLQSVVNEYIRDRRAKGISATTVAGYDVIMRRLDPRLGQLPISRVTTREVEHFYARLLQRPINLSREWKARQSRRTISPTSVHHTHELFRAAMNWAKRTGRASTDVFEHVETPRRNKVAGNALQRDDIAALLKEISGHRFEAAMLFALATGMRRGEVCGLRASSINPQAKSVLVRESRAADGGSGWRQKLTKTEHQRVVPLNALALRALGLQARLRARYTRVAGSAWQDSGFAFVDELGAPVSPDALTDAFRSAFARVEAKTDRHHRLHDLRHTAGSMMLHAGASVRDVADVLGHADPTTTLRIYAHAIEGGRRRAVNAIDTITRPKKSRRVPRRNTS